MIPYRLSTALCDMRYARIFQPLNFRLTWCSDSFVCEVCRCWGLLCILHHWQLSEWQFGKYCTVSLHYFKPTPRFQMENGTNAIWHLERVGQTLSQTDVNHLALICIFHWKPAWLPLPVWSRVSRCTYQSSSRTCLQITQTVWLENVNPVSTNDYFCLLNVTSYNLGL